MYSYAIVEEKSCTAEKGCKLCVLACPEPDTILIEKKDGVKVAVVVVDKCKGCELCVAACSVQKCVEMVHM